MIDNAMKVLNGDPDSIDSNISYSQTDPQTARFAESFKVKLKILITKDNIFGYFRQFINELKMNIIE
jgi:hypothetical protein